MGLTDLSWGNLRFTTVVDNGDPANRVDITILGDGYTAAQMGQYVQDVNTLVEAFRETEPIRTYFRHFNFHRVDVISAETGTDDAYANPPIARRTALDTFFSPIAERRLISYSPLVQAVASLSGAPWDFLLVVVNYPRYGGGVDAGMQVAYFTNDRSPDGFPLIALHEAGHSIVKLFEEYDATDLPDIDLIKGWTLPNILPWPNVDTNGADPKWSRWIAPGTPLPTPDIAANDNVVGAFEGAANMNNAVYRPKRTCLMRDHDSDFCEVCREEWVYVVYAKSTIADSFSPAYSLAVPPLMVSDSEQMTFRANLVRENGRFIHTLWQTKPLGNADWDDRQETDDYADFNVTLPAGRDPVSGLPLPSAWMIRCILQDRSPFLRTRTRRWEDMVIQRFVWQVIVNPMRDVHGDVTIRHGDSNLIPHGDSPLIPHGDVNLIPHGDSPLIPHGDANLIPHADSAAIPHGDTNMIPHGDVDPIAHGDATTWLGHVDVSATVHVDTPATAHVDTPAVGHFDSPPTAHVDTPSAGHVDVPATAHVDTSPVGHVDSPSVAHIDTPPQHIDSPPSRRHADAP